VSGKLLSVNVGSPREIEWLGRREATSIWKSPVDGRVPVRGVNVAGDDQADREVHGGPDKAIYAYAREDLDWWERELGREFEEGNFGENLTVSGVDVTGAVIGERWEVGSAVLEVAQPRIPCWKLGARMDDPSFPVHFAAAGRPGAYLRSSRRARSARVTRSASARSPSTGSPSATSRGSTTRSEAAAPFSSTRPSWQRAGGNGP
jgi:MOSC domain-containing protein YiiM